MLWQRFICPSGSFLQFAVDVGTFQCTVKPCKPAVNAAGPQQKFHQLPETAIRLRYFSP